MKKPTVLIINGSPHEKGTTTAVLGEMIATFEKEGVECRVIQIGKDPVRGGIGCASCKKTGRCADCLSPDTICASLVRTRFSRQKGRIKVILIDGEYGF